MAPLRLKVLRACERTIVSACGDIDMSTASRLDECVQREVDRGVNVIVVNLSHSEYLDSSGLAVLLRAHKRLRDLNGRLSVVGCRPCVLRVLQIVGFQHLFAVEEVRGRYKMPVTA